jgi:HEAT repeat protein
MPTFLITADTDPPSIAWIREQDPATRRDIVGGLADLGREEDVSVLVECLKDEHPGVQEAAVHGLARIGGDGVVRRLVGLLCEPPAVRNMAAEIISRVVPAGWDSLLDALGSPDPDVRKFVIDAFGKHENPHLIRPILPHLDDPNPNVRAAAAEALGHLRARDAVPGLIRLLSDEQWVRFSAVTALADIGDPAALTPLLGLIMQEDRAVAYAALEAIPALDPEGTALPALMDLADAVGDDLQPALVKTLVALTETRGGEVWAGLDRARWLPRLLDVLQGDEPEAQVAAMTALGLMRESSTARIVLEAYAAWDRPGDEVAERAVQALAGMGNTEELLAAVERGVEPPVKVAIRALGALRAADAVPVLAQVRRTSTDWERRRLAVVALGLIGTDAALEHLIEAVDDETGYVRRAAARVLGDFRHEAAESALVARLKTERYQEVRHEIADTLVRIGTYTVMIELMRLLACPRPEVREAAAWALGKARVPEGLEALIETLSDSDARVRRAVTEGISRYFDAKTLPSLLLALADEDEKVRLAAVLGVGQWRTPDAHVALLEQGLRDPDVWVRCRAAEQLGRHRVEAAVPALAALTGDPREPVLVKRAAVVALGNIGGARARTALLDCVSLADAELAAMAELALRRDEEGGAQRAG